MRISDWSSNVCSSDLVDQRAGHAKRFGAAPDIASVHRLIRGELRKSVILADQQQWKLPQGGDVQRLGNDALAGRTVTEKHHGNPALAVKLRAKCRTDREPYATPDTAVGAQYALRDVANMHRAALALAHAGARKSVGSGKRVFVPRHMGG